jgi:hypothetical protein
VPVPDKLVDAIDAALECEAQETNLDARVELLAQTRSALDSWLLGRMTTEEAIAALRRRAADTQAPRTAASH